MHDLNLEEHWQQCQAYIERALGREARLLGLQRLAKGTRAAPWRLEVAIGEARRAFLLRLSDENEARDCEREFAMLRAMQAIPIPAPRPYGWEPTGQALGAPCFLYDFVEGESLLGPVLAGEPWAEALFLDTVCALQSVSREQLTGVVDLLGKGESAAEVLEAAQAYFQAHPHPLAARAYAKLKSSLPEQPALRFSNGDLWLDNLIVRERQLAGVIDFENAGFSDPLFEFLLSFFVRPELRGRGIEERYCRRMGFDVQMLDWYHGLEYFDTLSWVLATGEAFEQYTAEVLESALRDWLDAPGPTPERMENGGNQP